MLSVLPLLKVFISCSFSADYLFSHSYGYIHKAKRCQVRVFYPAQST